MTYSGKSNIYYPSKFDELNFPIWKFKKTIFMNSLGNRVAVTPRSCGYGDVTAIYIRRSKISSHIYDKHQYMQESEFGSMWCIIHSNI